MSPLTLEIAVMPESCTSTEQRASLDETAQPGGGQVDYLGGDLTGATSTGVLWWVVEQVRH